MTRLLSPELLIRAYASGVFPMSESRSDSAIFWVDPKERGILPLDDFHVPKSLRKALKRNPFDIRTDTAFAEVIAACAQSSRGREDTWINDEIIRAYTELHHLGHVHSIECWQGDTLVGGLYGVRLGAAFFGESMFSRATDASKVALTHLVARLRLGGFKLLDTQFVTNHLKRFGAIEIPARDYLVLLDDALNAKAHYLTDEEVSEAEASDGRLSRELEALSLQSNTQTS